MVAVDRKTGQELLDSITLSTPPSALQVVLRELSFADGNGDLDQMDEIFSRDLIDHNPTFPGQSGYEGMRETLEGLRTGFSDFSHQILFIQELPDNWVALHHEFVGTHTGEFIGFPPTGNRITMKGTEIIHVVDGKVAETYHNEDSFGLFNGLQSSAK
jgi:predicted ester cyclase